MAASAMPSGEFVPTADSRIVMFDVRWEYYEVWVALRGEKSTPRMAYLDGVLELMSPSRFHERIKSLIGRCIEAYAAERGIVLSAYGQWTLKAASDRAGAEPDECYIFGAEQDKPRPDLAIEVVWTSGGVDKLAIYRRLGVPEVWVWKAGRLAVYVLADADYELRARSTYLPDLDVTTIEAVLDCPTLSEAVAAFQQALRGRER